MPDQPHTEGRGSTCPTCGCPASEGRSYRGYGKGNDDRPCDDTWHAQPDLRESSYLLQRDIGVIRRLIAALEPASTTGEARVEELRAAYEAGFEESSEGYNGEYVGRKHRGNWPHFLDDGFKEFLSTRAIPASTPEPPEDE